MSVIKSKHVMNKEEIFQHSDFFEAVQMQQVFPDGKTFADCIALSPFETIEQLYQQQKDATGFDLAEFVHAHFRILSPPQNYHTHDKNVVEHIQHLWPVLTRLPDKLNQQDYCSLLPLPYPYVVPGGRFGEIYYWDSYFTMLGLQVSGKDDMIENMINNFSHLIDTLGYIPNGNRSYFIGRSQPPFYSLMIKMLAEIKGNDILIKYMPQLEKEYAFWMKGAGELNENNNAKHHVVHMHDGSLLNRYWDENDTARPESYRQDIELAQHTGNKAILYRNIRAAAESGWDFSCRWFKNINDFTSIHTTDIIPVDLNCLILHLEEILAQCYKLIGNLPQHYLFLNKAAQRKNAIQHYCWNEAKQFYFDYDYSIGKQKELPTIAAAFPLFFNIASASQANAVALMIEKQFLLPGGVTTTLETSGQQWDAPNGWAPLQWITIKGLENYKLQSLATAIAKRWIALNRQVFERTGKLMEKYNVYNLQLDAGGGEYPSQDGFGWTNGVLLKLINSYEK